MYYTHTRIAFGWNWTFSPHNQFVYIVSGPLIIAISTHSFYQSLSSVWITKLWPFRIDTIRQVDGIVKKWNNFSNFQSAKVFVQVIVYCHPCLCKHWRWYRHRTTSSSSWAWPYAKLRILADRSTFKLHHLQHQSTEMFLRQRSFRAEHSEEKKHLEKNVEAKEIESACRRKLCSK